MTLGQLIERLEREDAGRVLSMGLAHPHSYRGYYSQLAFEPIGPVSVGEMLAQARSANGATFHGYKGGEYTMDLDTPVWVAAYGDCGEPIGPVLMRLMLS